VLTDEYGRYAKHLPLASGKIARVRADDGVHVTPAGASLLTGRCVESIRSAQAAPALLAERSPAQPADATPDREYLRGKEEADAAGATQIAAATLPNTPARAAEQGDERPNPVAASSSSSAAAVMTAAYGGEYRSQIRRTTKASVVQPVRTVAPALPETTAQQSAEAPETSLPTPSESRARVADASLRSVFAVQESSWQQPVLAERRAALLRRKGLQTRVIGVDLGDKGVWHRVVIGAVDTLEGARALQAQLSERFQLTRTLILKSS